MYVATTVRTCSASVDLDEGNDYPSSGLSSVALRVNILFFSVSIGNAEALGLVDTALFAFALEDSTSENPVELSRLFLYGDAASRYEI